MKFSITRAFLMAFHLLPITDSEKWIRLKRTHGARLKVRTMKDIERNRLSAEKL